MKRKTTFFAVLVLSACASAPQYKWSKAGATQSELSAAAGQCESQAFGSPTHDQNRLFMVYASCMQGKGWNLVER